VRGGERSAAYVPPHDADDAEGELVPASAPPSEAKTMSPQRRRDLRIFIGPTLVQKSVPLAARPRVAFVERGEGHPAGLAFQSVGALVGTIQPRDILIEAEGQPITGLELLVSVVGKSYEHRAKYLSGRLWRRGELFAVTVEPGW
jgi:hypothetical protein